MLTNKQQKLPWQAFEFFCMSNTKLVFIWLMNITALLWIPVQKSKIVTLSPPLPSSCAYKLNRKVHQSNLEEEAASTKLHQRHTYSFQVNSSLIWHNNFLLAGHNWLRWYNGAKQSTRHIWNQSGLYLPTNAYLCAVSGAVKCANKFSQISVNIWARGR